MRDAVERDHYQSKVTGIEKISDEAELLNEAALLDDSDGLESKQTLSSTFARKADVTFERPADTPQDIPIPERKDSSRVLSGRR